ncbi:hypothetical protein EGW08_012280 [Elysia chlorotica]|uniref:Uncharacterized protein n=1 Tax=Elysia chlorotica TaxID=188477 RepID=A0A3S1B4V5_ELYCH|nr:hypothetical protein EGW08_012280 [Elysia chlorotica]
MSLQKPSRASPLQRQPTAQPIRRRAQLIKRPSQPPSSPTKKSVYMVIHSQDEVHAPDSPRKIRVKESLTPLKTTGVQNSPFFSPSKFSKNKYLAGLGLMPIQKARRVSERRRSTKCENIDLDEDTLPSPTKPRTPKLLISHLSRDESGAAADNNRSCMRSLFSSQSSRVDGDGESDSHREGCERRDGKSDDYEKVSDRLRNVKSLFNIAVSSPLGQCVIKHYKGDPSLHILSDTESHCLTEIIKNKQEGCRLRTRHMVYPVTFRGDSRRKTSYCHKYNMTKAHKKEFMRNTATGLDSKSRALLKKLKKCKVDLTKLTKADLKIWMPSENHLTVDLKPLTNQEMKYWMSPKPLSVSTSEQPAVFPSGLSLTSPNLNKVLGLRTRGDKDQSPEPLYPHLSVTNFVSEEVAAEVTENRRTVLNSILSDFVAKGEISKDLLPDNAAMPVKYATLRSLLTSPSLQAGKGKLHTLPDITNLGPAARSKALRANSRQLDLENQPSRNKLGENSAHKETTSKDNILKVRPKSRRKSEVSESHPVRFSPRLSQSQTKSTSVRLALEGETITGCDYEVPHSSTEKTDGLVFPGELASRPGSSSSNSSEHLSRTLRKRQSKTNTAQQQQESALNTPSSNESSQNGQVVKNDNPRLEKIILCQQSASTAGESPSYSSHSKSRTYLKSSPCDGSIALPQTKSPMFDVKLKKKLMKAGLVWRVSHSPSSGRDQENESDLSADFPVDKPRAAQDNCGASNVTTRVDGLKSERRPRSTTRENRAGTVTKRCRKGGQKEKSESGKLRKNMGGLVRTPRLLSRKGLSSHNKKALVSSSAGKRSGTPGRKPFYTNIKAKVTSKKNPMPVDFV